MTDMSSTKEQARGIPLEGSTDLSGQSLSDRLRAAASSEALENDPDRTVQLEKLADYLERVHLILERHPSIPKFRRQTIDLPPPAAVKDTRGSENN